MKARGFTLIELVMVMVITGIIAATLVVFMKPAVDSYFDTRRRAEMTDMADTALRQMTQDIHRAVPNSIRRHTENCIQLVPTITGGRYRMAPDTVNAGSNALDTSIATSAFDVLTQLHKLPAANDWVVIGNQDRDDVYDGDNRVQIASVTADTPTDLVRRHLITLLASMQFPVGYDGGRFVVVADNEQSVFYNCTGGKLYRSIATFGDGVARCSTAGALLASDASCNFTYDIGITEQSALVWLELQISRDNENVTLAQAVHVDNLP